MTSKIDSLAYIVAQSNDLAKWRDYAENMLGMSVADGADGSLLVKMDERDFRFQVVPGDENKYLVSGWQVTDAAALEAVAAAAEAAGLSVEQGSAEDCAARKVEKLVRFTDPSGNQHEAVLGYTGAAEAFSSPIGVAGFLTGAQGLGHTVLPALNFDATMDFFVDKLGFGVSDEFDFQPPVPDAPVVRIRFLHTNTRHHSLALAEMPEPSGCVHAMVEVTSMTDVGKAHDRLQQRGEKLMATLGQHANDKMTSFYMKTPSEFALEYGWGGATVEPGSHETTRHDAPSIWGHDFTVGFQ